MKTIQTIIIGLTASLAIATAVPSFAGTLTEPATEFTVVSQQGEQTDVQVDWTPSNEVNTVQESQMTREMIRAEKAKNAQENDEYGLAITIIAMGIVIGALIVLSLLFLGFGRISTAFQKNRKRKAHGVDELTAEDHHDELDSGEVIAAISMALAEHTGQGHDIEDTILTIRKLRKAYSPWNSKIYNLRLTPEQPASPQRPLKK